MRHLKNIIFILTFYTGLYAEANRVILVMIDGYTKAYDYNSDSWSSRSIVSAEIQVKLLQTGSATVSFNGSDAFIGPENNSISITETIDGLISIQ